MICRDRGDDNGAIEWAFLVGVILTCICTYPFTFSNSPALRRLLALARIGGGSSY